MRDVTVDDLAVALDEGAAVIDVREHMEWVRGHIPGTSLMPMSQLGARVGELDRSSRLYVLCQSGNRSGAMTDALRSMGFDAWSVQGGVGAWLRSGRSVATGTAA
ncbi:MAG: rhodanese-like domain-containing protein [Nocardioidaceae bacterium]|nr:rhodanese-like domain-containing protein [Nocardioidaceae bacterium]